MYNIGGPNAPYSLAPATYTVEASADGYNTVTKTITVNEGDDIEEDFILQPGPPPLPGYANPPQDLDGDGLYEDVNGDGQFDIFDVQALFETHTSGVVQDHPWAFNFSEEDDPDGVSIVDVQALFDRL